MSGWRGKCFLLVEVEGGGPPQSSHKIVLDRLRILGVGEGRVHHCQNHYCQISSETLRD